MECNVGKTEKIVRLILGLVFVWLGYAGSPWWYLVAIILILTASIGFCPLSKLLGINTCKQKETKGEDKTSIPEKTEPQEEQQTESEQKTEENN